MSSHPDHDALMDSAAAWLLGALPDDEAETFSDHLDSCPSCQNAVARQRATVNALALAPPPATPSPQLKAAVMAQVIREAELLAASGPQADRPLRTRRTPGWLARLSRPWAIATATVGVTALVAIGAVFGVLAGGGSQHEATSPVTMANLTSNATGTLSVSDDRSELQVSHVPAPADGRVYQAWLVRDGKATSGGVFTVDRDGDGSVVLHGPVKDADQVLVTNEPRGGSAAPTTKPVMSAVPA